MNKLNDLCERLLANYNKNSDVVPDGFYTLKQIAKGINKSVPTAARLVHAQMAEGKIEVAMFRIDTTRGVYPVRHYRHVDSK